jgi:transcriptional regulator CtsR
MGLTNESKAKCLMSIELVKKTGEKIPAGVTVETIDKVIQRLNSIDTSIFLELEKDIRLAIAETLAKLEEAREAAIFSIFQRLPWPIPTREYPENSWGRKKVIESIVAAIKGNTATQLAEKIVAGTLHEAVLMDWDKVPNVY